MCSGCSEGAYLLHAAEGVHVVEDGDHLAVCLLGVQDVAADLQVFHHELHQEGAQLQHQHGGPWGVVPLEGGP